MEFKPPSSMNFVGDLSQNWLIFKQKFDIFLKANELEQKSGEIKTAMLLNCIGDDGLKLYNTFKLNEVGKKGL